MEGSSVSLCVGLDDGGELRLTHKVGWRRELCLTALQSTAAREPPDPTTHNSPDNSLSKTTEVLFNLKWSATDTLLNWKTEKQLQEKIQVLLKR